MRCKLCAPFWFDRNKMPRGESLAVKSRSSLTDLYTLKNLTTFYAGD